MTRKEFIGVAAGAAAFAAVPSSGLFAAQGAQPSTAGKIKRGVSVYSYSGLLNWNMTLEDCFSEIADTGAPGLEILANGHIIHQTLLG